MINYSIVNRTVNQNLLEVNQAKARVAKAKEAGITPDSTDVELANTPMQYRAYAVAQYSDVMTIEKFAKHISEHGCVYSRADISAILYMAVDCMREQLLEGKKIRLGDLGDFSVSLSSKGAESADKFSAQNITAVNVNWECGTEFRNLIEDAEFNLVASRSAQAAVLKAIKAGETVVDLNKPEGTDPDGNGGGNPSNPSNPSTPSDDAPIDGLYQLTLMSADEDAGSVNTKRNGLYSPGSRIDASATPASGYEFDHWSDGSTEASRTLEMNRHYHLVAFFREA